MKKSEINFIVGIIIFVFGLTNIIPSEISLYDEYVIPHIEDNATEENVFYPHITIIIAFFRILIVVATFLEGYKIFKYGVRYNVFGLRDLVYR